MKLSVEIEVREDHVWAVTLRHSPTLSVDAPLPSAKRWIDAYLEGEKAPLPPLAWERCTPFQHQVLHTLLQTPFGQTTTYSALAKQAKRPRAARAVGNALGANPFPLLLPCHRVLAANGMGGFSCGLPIKETLLLHEQT